MFCFLKKISTYYYILFFIQTDPNKDESSKSKWLHGRGWPDFKIWI